MCACKILEYFQITQPTLSYHMKILTDCGIVKAKKEGSWVVYSNNEEVISEIHDFWIKITEPQEDCICKFTKEVK
jgi:ArsR family transcriptional regulator